jgi:multimeric flavodoxin WrbA
MAKVKVRQGMPSVQLSREQLAERLRERFADPAFDAVRDEIEKIVKVAWDGYDEYRKAPRTRKAGRAYADPGYDLSVDWLKARTDIKAAEKGQRDPGSRSRILIVNGSSRSNQTCPGEESKTWRLAKIAERIIKGTRGFEVDFLDLSNLASEYGRQILPCKACVSTAMPLCHWPCSCYPNHAMGQVNDWMNEIYPRWSAAHGVMILTPVNWFQAPSGLKAMMDRLVCADGGNPDPTTTSGKDPEKAKAIELKGWDYPKHLAGRTFAVVVHGDVEGVETLRRMLTDWLLTLGLIPAGTKSQVGGYVGYMEPYATSHNDLDRDKGFQEEVRNATRALIRSVRMLRRGELAQPDEGLAEPRPK